MYVTAFNLFFTTILTRKKSFFFWRAWPRSWHKARLFAKIQLQLSSYWKYSSRIIIILRPNTHIGIGNGAAMEEAIWKGQSTGVWKKKALRDTLTWAAVCGLIYNGKLANQTARLVAIVVKSQLIRFIYLLRSFSYRYQAKSELVSAHNRNGIIE